MARTDEDLYAEQRVCNQCGEMWLDTGDETCPHCESTNTGIIDLEDLDEAEPSDV